MNKKSITRDNAPSYKNDDDERNLQNNKVKKMMTTKLIR